MSLYESLIRPALFLLDPETAHEWGMNMIRRGAVKARQVVDPRLEQTLFGVRFKNPVGLAAGFDKNAVALDYWDDLGFGFAEIGTITRLPQPGNPKPRLFRLPAEKALINRMGFNNDGSEAIADRIEHSHPTLPIGINLGKSKIAPIDQAAADYQASYRRLSGMGDYFVVNVSSPNTPGLRGLQEKGALDEIVSAIRDVDFTRPLFIKISPDLSLGAIEDVVEVAVDNRITGLIATNTTLSRDGLTSNPNQEGGLSGKPLTETANQVMAHLYANVPREMVLIGVGGIFSADDLVNRIAAGAHLCQIYTGWIYGGPQTVPRLLEGMLESMDALGIQSLEELRGANVVEG